MSRELQPTCLRAGKWLEIKHSQLPEFVSQSMTVFPTDHHWTGFAVRAVLYSGVYSACDNVGIGKGIRPSSEQL